MKILFILSFIFSATLVHGQTTSKAPFTTLAFDTIYTKPEVFAVYPGGEEAWKAYLKKHMKYPKKAKWAQLETEVIVKVVIDKEGNIREARHLTISGYGFEHEAVRLVSKSGKWIPAMHNGHPVVCEGTLKIEFRLK